MTDWEETCVFEALAALKSLESLAEIRDLLKQVLERLPQPVMISGPPGNVCPKCGGMNVSIPRLGISHMCPVSVPPTSAQTTGNEK